MSAIEAAGCVLWRAVDAPAGVEVALVHRPRYDEWSVPKGTLRRGEHPLLAAVREVGEETGLTGPLGRPLGELRYKTRGRPKRVRYWAMRHRPGEVGAGHLQAGDEVDRLRWLPPAEAARLMPAGHDQPVIDELARDPRPTRAVVVVRHASAGSRKRWKGPDRDRPLDSRGRDQAERLAGLIALYGVERAYSADTRRCVETVGPFAQRAGLSVHEEPLMSEDGYRADPDGALRRLTEIVAGPQPCVVSTQRKTLPALTDLLAALGQRRPQQVALAKGEFLVLHLTEGEDPHLVSVDTFA